MALNYVTLTCDLFDPTGQRVKSGLATFTPSAVLTDTVDHEYIPQAPVVARFESAAASPTVTLLATDNAAVQPSGWAWGVAFTGVPGNPQPFNFFLPFAGGGTQNLSSQAPVQTVTASQALMPLPTGTPVAGQVPVATGAGEASAWGQYPLMAKVADTGPTGFALQNGTPNIMSWTTPNDGNQHFFMIVGQLHVTSGETGGGTQAAYTQPDGTPTTTQHDNGGHGVSTTGLNFFARGVAPNTTVTYSQSSALTAGAALLFAAILGV